MTGQQGEGKAKFQTLKTKLRPKRHKRQVIKYLQYDCPSKVQY